MYRFGELNAGALQPQSARNRDSTRLANLPPCTFARFVRPHVPFHNLHSEKSKMKRPPSIVLRVRTRAGFIYYRATALVLLGFLLTPALTAPTSMDLCNPNLSLCNKKNCKPWYDPCSNEHNTRHSRSTRNIVKNQMRTVVRNLENVSIPNLEELYSQIKHLEKPKLDFPWLKNRKFLNILKKNDNKTLLDFYNQIQLYSGTIYRLSLIEINTNAPHFDSGKRCAILNSVQLELRRFLCELAFTIESKEQKVPDFIDDEEMNIKFPATADATKGSVYDSGILKKLKVFLKRSNRILSPGKNRKRKPSHKNALRKSKRKQKKQ